MKQSIKLFSLLNADDRCWILENCKIRECQKGEVIVRQGDNERCIYIIAGGLIGVYDSQVGVEGDAAKYRRLLTLDQGEVFGISSYLDESPSQTMLRAEEDSTLFVLDNELIERYAESNPKFAIDFYKAVAVLLSDMVKKINHNYINFIERDVRSYTNVNEKPFHDFNRIFAEFKKHTIQLKDKAEVDNSITAQYSERLESSFRELLQLCEENYALNLQRSGYPKQESKFNEYVVSELLPYLMMSDCVAYCLKQAQGYHGDYVLIKKIYENHPRGVGVIGEMIDRAFLALPPCDFVRTRANTMIRYIYSIIESNGYSDMNVASISCGPAYEVFSIFDGIGKEYPFTLNFSLYDFNESAITYLDDQIDKNDLRDQIKPTYCDKLTFLYSCDAPIANSQQFVYSLGMLNYLDDKAGIALINRMYDMLNPGGTAVVSVFNTVEHSRFAMEVLLNWQVNFRDEESLSELFQQSKFNSSFERCWQESDIGSFASITK